MLNKFASCVGMPLHTLKGGIFNADVMWWQCQIPSRTVRSKCEDIFLQHSSEIPTFDKSPADFSRYTYWRLFQSFSEQIKLFKLELSIVHKFT